MKILVLSTLCLLCISVKSIQGKNLTLTFSKNFCLRGIKCLNSTSFAFCQSTDGYFAIGKEIFDCSLGKECDDYNLKSCLTQEMANKLKEDRGINFYINYNDLRTSSKSNQTQHINVLLKIKKRKLQAENETVTPNPETDTSTASTTNEAEDFHHSDESTESAEDKTTSTDSAETECTDLTDTYRTTDETTDVSGATIDATETDTPYEYDTDVKALADKFSKTETTPVSIYESPSSESFKDEATQVPTTESIEEEAHDVSTIDSLKEETPDASSITKSVEKDRPDKPTTEPFEEETTFDVPKQVLSDESSRNKIKPRTQSNDSTLPKLSKRKVNENRGFYVQFIRQGRKREHIEAATFVNLDHGNMADYMPTYLKKYSEIRMHTGGLKTVNKTCFGHVKSDGIYGIKFEGLLENVSPGTFNDLHDLVWVKLNGHLLRRIESYVFTGLNIREVDLRDNMIDYLAPNAFDNMSYLEKIDVTHNNLKEYDSSWFFNAHKLTQVIFSNNYLQQIPAFAFKNLDLFGRKINFYFDQNSIKKVHRNVYFKTRKDARHVPNGWVNTLFLNSNNLHCVPEITMKRTRHLSLEDNPLSCGCIRRLKIEAQGRHGHNSTSIRLTKKSVKACLL